MMVRTPGVVICATTPKFKVWSQGDHFYDSEN